MKNKLKVHCDMDGVLVDFDKRYDEIIGGRKNRPHPDDDDAFWMPVLETPDFWLSLEWMPGGQKLWSYLQQHTYVVILTSPGNHDRERAIRQKRQWIQKNIGHANLVFKYSKEKHHYACPNSILIDDWSPNVKAWEQAGGIAIKHRDTEQTIARLKELGLDYVDLGDCG